MREVPGSNPIEEITFVGGKTCSTATYGPKPHILPVGYLPLCINCIINNTSSSLFFKTDHKIIILNKYCIKISQLFHFDTFETGLVWFISFIGGGNRSTRRKPTTCRRSLTNSITLCCIEYFSPWTGFELTTLVVIGINCTGSCNTITVRSHRPLKTALLRNT